MAPRLRSSASDGDHEEVITEHGGSERLDDRGSAEWRPVGGGSSRPRRHGRAQLRREGEPGIGLWRGGGTARLKRGRQEIYDVIEISLVVDTLEPGLIRGARMRECDRDDDQKSEQHGDQAGHAHVGCRSPCPRHTQRKGARPQPYRTRRVTHTRHPSLQRSCTSRWAPTASQSIASEGSGVQGNKRRNRVKKCKALTGRELTQETQTT